MRKAGAILICLLFILNFFIIVSIASADVEDEVPGIPSALQPDKLDETKAKAESQWDYLKKEWKNMLLKNPIVAAIDSFLSKISIVFSVLFGMPYSMSVELLGVIVLWFIIALTFADVMRGFNLLSWEIGTLILGMMIAILLAQIQVLSGIVNFMGWLLFSQKAWYWRILIFVIELTVIITFIVGMNKLSKFAEKRRKARAEKTQEKNQIVLAKVVGGIKEGFSHGEGI